MSEKVREFKLGEQFKISVSEAEIIDGKDIHVINEYDCVAAEFQWRLDGELIYRQSEYGPKPTVDGMAELLDTMRFLAAARVRLTNNARLRKNLECAMWTAQEGGGVEELGRALEDLCRNSDPPIPVPAIGKDMAERNAVVQKLLEDTEDEE